MKELCPPCPRKQKHPQASLVNRLLGKLVLQDNGCQLDRHELKNYEWPWLNIIKAEREKVSRTAQ